MFSREGALFTSRLFGIDIIVSPSFLFLMAFFVFMSGSLVSGLVMAASLALIVIVHELGHALTALRFGRSVPAINLNGLGGAAYVEHSSDRHGENILIRLAGPAVNLMTAAALFLVTKVIDVGALPSLMGLIIDQVFLYSLVLGIFNLIPAEPLDGGRILSGVLQGYTSVNHPQRTMALVSLIIWGLMFCLGLSMSQFLLVLIAGFMGFENYQRYRSYCS